MGSCSSTARAAATHSPPPDFTQDLVASGEFVELGPNFVATAPTIFECDLLAITFDWHPIKGESIYTCELTPEMDAEIIRVQRAYQHIDIRRGTRLFVQSLNADVKKVRVSLYLIRHPHYTNTLQIGWRFMGAVL
jgi:hypothetical protein